MPMAYDKNFFVYILASRKEGALYIGVTSNLRGRIYQHRNKEFSGHTSKYNINKLVYYEHLPNAQAAIRREKCLKKWKREWKIRLIEENNPSWDDLYNMC